MRAVICIFVCIILIVGSGCGPNRETAAPAPAEMKKQTGASQVVSDDKSKAEADDNKPAEAPNLKKFGAIERVPERIKADFYYVRAIPKSYLIAKEFAVNIANGYKSTAMYFDDDSAIFQSEKKYMEDCFARGIKLRLIDYRELALEKGRVLSHSLSFTSHEARIYVEYSYEHTYTDNRKETKKERKVFTVREEREKGQGLGPKEAVPFSNRITVVIANIEDATEIPKESASKD